VHIQKNYIGPRDTWIPRIEKSLRQYKAKHVDSGSFTPLKQVMIGVFALSYVTGLPAELRHLRHEEAKKRGEKH